ncbi:putative bifunctional diguanylate cyclase/phosphodiesterase [Kozakia baliensis]|uniref:putative bifunctional diguanylate cyclase/phosphodiesterase n=1 Tax=Kozakia baliensis TaxID=153496 RepID=UPI00087C3B7A|nr:bifunctional diguanylate cyclase/phosphodiesterase [Kozakia baliensis]AOX19699.1 hypothetical protein A0U90_04735 [Kozakia baliensis]
MPQTFLHEAQTARHSLLQIARHLFGASSVLLASIEKNGTFKEILRAGDVDIVFPSDIVRQLADSSAPVVLKTPDAQWLGISLGHQSCLVLAVPSEITVPDDKISDLSDFSACLNELRKSDSQASRRPDLLNRTSSLSNIQKLIEDNRDADKRHSFGVIRLDLDHLAQINNRHGWDTADYLIDEMISRIQSVLPSDSMVGYFGGGSLIVITPYGTSITNTHSLINAMTRELDLPAYLKDGSFNFSVSIGWSMFPKDGDNATALFEGACAALAEAIQEGGAHERRATPDTTERYLDASRLERDLLHAIEKETLSLSWMPIVAVHSQQVIALEALVRWERPNFGPVSPELFVRCAEEAGLVERLDCWSLLAACRIAVKWPHALRVCVNISPVWLANERLSSMVEAVLKETELPAHRLQIELSEKRPFGPRDIAYQELSRLRALGVHVALDDFGAGYSSLERLASFPVDQIKLDRSFINRLDEDRRVGDILRSTLQLARTLGVSCCAKGVETERQMSFLDSYGCEEVQGYLLGSPSANYLQSMESELHGELQ